MVHGGNDRVVANAGDEVAAEVGCGYRMGFVELHHPLGHLRNDYFEEFFLCSADVPVLRNKSRRLQRVAQTAAPADVHAGCKDGVPILTSRLPLVQILALEREKEDDDVVGFSRLV